LVTPGAIFTLLQKRKAISDSLSPCQQSLVDVLSLAGPRNQDAAVIPFVDTTPHRNVPLYMSPESRVQSPAKGKAEAETRGGIGVSMCKSIEVF